MPGFRNIPRYAAAFVLLFALSTPLAELAFRMMGGGPPEDLRGLFQPFGRISFKMAPLVNTGSKFAFGHRTVYTDALGLRCDAARHFGAKPGSHLDVLLLGDSQLFGSGLDYEETLPGRMARYAAEKGEHLANAAVNGHSLLEQLELAKWVHETNHVSVGTYVLFNTCNMVCAPEHYWAMVAGPDGRLYTTETKYLRVVSWLREHSTAFTRFREARQIWRQRKNELPPMLSLLIQRFGTHSAEASEQERFLAALNELNRWVEAQHAKLLVLYLPIPLEVQPGDLIETAQRMGIPLDLERPQRICEAAARELKIPFETLLPNVKAFEKTGEPLRLQGDPHFTARFWEFCWRDIWQFIDISRAKSPPLNEQRIQRQPDA